MTANSTRQNEPRNAPKWIKAFVVFHVIAITVWALPKAPKQYSEGTAKFGFRTDGVGPFLSSTRDLLADGTLYFNDTFVRPSPIKYYDLGTGFWQYWDMFSPNPARIDFWGDADIVYKDGSQRHYQYPRMYTLPIPMKYLKERYRKFYERANADICEYLWPQFAQRIAYLNNPNPGNPPVQVRLTRHWQNVAPPGEVQVEDYNSFTYFIWEVDQRALPTGKPIDHSELLQDERKVVHGRPYP